MDKIQRYFDFCAKRLRDDFERTRQIHRDSDVKGGANEGILCDFVRDHYPAQFVTNNADIIDSYGMITQELDVCVCNRDQPFGPAPGQPLIAEGVDLVIQVKAILNTQELGRIVENARSVKLLRRKETDGTTTFAKIEDQEYYLLRIPFIAFAFTSSITLDKVHEEISTLLETVPQAEQPDALFVLDRGFLLNFREGRGKAWKVAGQPLRGWGIGEAGERTLFEMMRYLFSVVPRIHRFTHPLANYFTPEVSFKFKCPEASFLFSGLHI